MSDHHDICPFLGLQSDSSVRLSYPDGAHRCYAAPDGENYLPDVEQQQSFCLTAQHVTCPRYGLAGGHAVSSSPNAPQSKRRQLSLRNALWIGVGLAALLVVWQLIRLLAQPPEARQPIAPAVSVTPTLAAPAVMPTPDPGFTVAAATSTPTAAIGLIEEITTPTVAAGDLLFNLAPEASGVGWVSSDEARGNHLGDSFLHVGTVDGNIFHGVVQFNLSRVPRGAPLRAVFVNLTGLDDTRLDRSSNDSWQLRWLTPEIDEEWSRSNFQTIHNAPVLQTILPAYRQEQLAPLAHNQFAFDAAQIDLLQQALIDNQSLLTLRLDGPMGGSDNLFTWDSGFGPSSLQNAPSLWLLTGPPPATPPPIPTQDYVVVTSTPTPENVLTAAAQVETAAAIEQQIGTATPTPRTIVTATPTPLNESTAEAQRLAAGLPFVVIDTPTPGNAATAAFNAAYATAVAKTTGTWTPLPKDHVTATPTATFAVVTNTPTARTIFELLDRAIAEATRTATAGPPTPFPPWVVTATATPTRTPEPLNAETAQARIVLITVEALIYGAWTPTPTATRIPPSQTGVTPASPTLAPVEITLQEGAPVGAVIAEVANVRSGPDVGFGALAQAPNGSQLSLVGRTEDSAWLAVCCIDGEQGWIATYLVASEIDVTTLPVLPAAGQSRAPAGQHGAWLIDVVRHVLTRLTNTAVATVL